VENELNDNYACEGLTILIESQDGRAENIIVYDTFAGKVVVT
jgi:hypothetical protein